MSSNLFLMYSSHLFILGTILLSILYSFIRDLKSFVDTIPISMETIDRLHFMVGIFWCVPNTLDELLVQWLMMVDGRF